MKRMILTFGCICLGVLMVRASSFKHPNFVWFMAEDISTHTLRIYNPSAAPAPHLEKLAKDGLIFRNAYCNAPVCSAARSTLFTGFYAPKIGLSFHRKLKLFSLPKGSHLFPTYLRKKGYFTVNSLKTDYNCKMDPDAWDIVKGRLGDWRKRKDPSQSFFFVRTNVKTHESCLHTYQMNKKKPMYDSSKVKVYPFHPDTPCFRTTYATLYDRIADADREFGRMIKMLKQDGLLDDTFVVYIGDNGGCQAGTKAYTGETGLHVPMVIYVPKNWRHLVPFTPGSDVTGLVSFMDFGPTLLHLAGVDISPDMDGTPFLGKDLTRKMIEKRNIAFGYGDRFDNLYAFNRVVNQGNFKYSRNYQPYLPRILHHFYRYHQRAFVEWTELFHQGKLNEAQKRFFQPQGAEELYDLSKDPYELHNLVLDSHYAQKLGEMRKILKQNILSKGDLGFIPEGEWLEKGGDDPGSYCQAQKKNIARYLELADLQLVPFPKAQKRLNAALSSFDPIERYWGASVCISFGKQAQPLRSKVEKLLKDPSVRVRAKAATFLTILGKIDPQETFKDVLRHSDSSADTILILNDALFLKECGYAPKLVLERSDLQGKTQNEVELIKSIKAVEKYGEGKE